MGLLAIEPGFDEPGLTPAGLRILDAASDLFYAEGIRAVGVDRVAEVAGTTKKTLYDRFGSKDELVALYLARRAARWQRYVLGRLATADLRDRPLVVLDALGQWHTDPDRGCAFVNAHAELGSPDHPATATIRDEKSWMRRLFVALATDAGLREPESLGASLHLLYEGALVVSSTGGVASALIEARVAAAQLIELSRA